MYVYTCEQVHVSVSVYVVCVSGPVCACRYTCQSAYVQVREQKMFFSYYHVNPRLRSRIGMCLPAKLSCQPKNNF